VQSALSADALVRAGIGAGLFVALLACERRWPLRAATGAKASRIATNLGIALAGSIVTLFLYTPIVLPAARFAREHELGLLHWLGASGWLRFALSLLLLDSTLWVWHLLNHRSAFLWRFHAAHHADVDLDASTALRFHFGELALSVPFRATQVALFGIAFADLMLWETLLFAAIFFHHSNLRLSARVDAALRRIVVTPRLHGIHHSIVPAEVNSNFGTLFTVWDRLFRTYLEGVPQERITIGVPEVRPPGLGLLGSLALPFRRVRPARPRSPAAS